MNENEMDEMIEPAVVVAEPVDDSNGWKNGSSRMCVF